MSAADPSVIPTQSSSANEWQAWYDILPFSQKDNNLLFTRAWKIRGSDSVLSNADFKKYMQSNGVNLKSGTVAETVTNFTESVFDSVATTLKTGATVVIVMEVSVVVFVAALLWRVLTPDNFGKLEEIGGKAALVA